jgi:hypothetical protein
MRSVMAILVGIGLAFGPAHAEKKKNVDWGEFLEKPGDKVTYKRASSEDREKVIQEAVGKQPGKAKKRGAVKARAKKAKKSRK